MPSFKKTVLGAIAGRVMAQASVDDIDVISDRFRLITLSSEKFQGATMQPAAKVRLNARNWDMRAYTPLSLDTVAGRIQILAYLHGEGPGSQWTRSAVPGALTHIMGLQPSLDLLDLSRPVVFQRALASVGTPHLVLTGNGRSIQAIRTILRISYSRVIDYRVKAYWAPGKFGLE